MENTVKVTSIFIDDFRGNSNKLNKHKTLELYNAAEPTNDK